MEDYQLCRLLAKTIINEKESDFRTDANTKIGRGHLSRCIAIAEMLCDDFDILFVSHKENGMYIENLTLQYQLETIKSDTDFFYGKS